MIKIILNYIKKFEYVSKPNSYIHQTTIDLIYDSDQNLILKYIWRFFCFLNYILAYILKNILLIIEFIFIKKINNYKFFINRDNNNRALIFGSASSLNDFNSNIVLKNDKTFVCNSFFLSKISNQLKANYYTILNTSWIRRLKSYDDQNEANLNNIFAKLGKDFSDSKFVFSKKYTKDFKSYIEKNIINYFYFNISSLSPINYFPKIINYKTIIPHPVDVVQFNMILAYALGFKEIYLISVEHPFESNLLEGYDKCSDTPENINSLAAFSFKQRSKLLEQKKNLISGNLDDEELYFNHAWWHWFRGYNYYYLFQIFKKAGINVYRHNNRGTLNFIPIKNLN